MRLLLILFLCLSSHLLHSDPICETCDLDKVKVTHLDIDESPGTASKYGIRGVPTLMVFRGGELVAQHIGAAPKTTIAQLMDRAL